MKILLESLPVAGLVHLRISTGRDLDHLAVMGYLVMDQNDFQQFSEHCRLENEHVQWAIMPQILPCRDTTVTYGYIH